MKFQHLLSLSLTLLQAPIVFGYASYDLIQACRGWLSIQNAHPMHANDGVYIDGHVAKVGKFLAINGIDVNAMHMFDKPCLMIAAERKCHFKWMHMYLTGHDHRRSCGCRREIIGAE